MKNKNHNLKVAVVLAIFLSGLFVFGLAHKALALAGPTILTPKEGSSIPPDTQLVITGLVPNDSSVFFFIDGKLVGGYKAKNGKKGTASFAFKPKKIYSAGKHTIQAQAVRGNEKSIYSEKRTFIIPKTWPRRLDGVIVDSSKANVMPYAVMIENLAQVRPQSGLASASVVYETLAEGGVPRFIAIFARDDMSKVGPVRSTRPYYVDWAKEYGAPVLHAGGSRDAFKELGRLGVKSIDALVNKTARYFFRLGNYVSTHNLFTNSKLIKAIKKDFGLDKLKATFEAWKFKDDPPLAKRPNEKRQLIIDFKSGSQYIVAYKYNRNFNSYLRFNGGKPHLDANYKQKTQIEVKNVVVQLVEKERVLDWQKHLALQITGMGRGWLLQDGKLHQIIWKKPKPESRTKYYFLNGKEVEFNRGNTWIEVVPKDRPVLFK